MSKTDTARKICGDNSRLGRKELDFYPTPANAVIKFLEREKFEGDIWECACGRGDISIILEDFNYNVISSDIKRLWLWRNRNRFFKSR